MFGVIKDAVDLDLGDIGVKINREVVGDGGEDDDGADEEGGEETEKDGNCSSPDEGHAGRRRGRKGARGRRTEGGTEPRSGRFSK